MKKIGVKKSNRSWKIALMTMIRQITLNQMNKGKNNAIDSK